MQLTGKLIKVHPQIERGNFTSRRVWLQTDFTTQYPQTVELEVSQAKVNLFNNIAPGTVVDVEFNLRGRTWTNPQGDEKCFNTLAIWKVSVGGRAVDAGAYVPPVTHDAPAGYKTEGKQTTEQGTEIVDDLPF